MPQILHRGGRLRGARVRAGQPFAELMSGFRRRRTIKRHQRRRDAGDSDDVRAPAILGDVSDFDQVVAAGDRLFEAMN